METERLPKHFENSFRFGRDFVVFFFSLRIIQGLDCSTSLCENRKRLEKRTLGAEVCVLFRLEISWHAKNGRWLRCGVTFVSQQLPGTTFIFGKAIRSLLSINLPASFPPVEEKRRKKPHRCRSA